MPCDRTQGLIELARATAPLATLNSPLSLAFTASRRRSSAKSPLCRSWRELAYAALWLGGACKVFRAASVMRSRSMAVPRARASAERDLKLSSPPEECGFGRGQGGRIGLGRNRSSLQMGDFMQPRYRTQVRTVRARPG
jgi:hypothetical protein